jgi:hypothetical protein
MDKVKLGEPSVKLATTVLAKVRFEDRFSAVMIDPRTGPMPIAVYSFQELANLLSAPSLYLDLKALERWVKEVMGDDELAAGIAQVTQQATGHRERTLLIRDLMHERLSQCKGAQQEDQEDS